MSNETMNRSVRNLQNGKKIVDSYLSDRVNIQIYKEPRQLNNPIKKNGQMI